MEHHIAQKLQSIESLARLMDSRFKIPGTSLGLGIDSLIGIIPGIGDTVSLGVAAYIVHQSAKLGVSKSKLIRMSLNIFIDWLIGLIPLIGDLFDWGWKANNKNAAILREHLEGQYARPITEKTQL